jgi:hypothetical protein
METSTLISGFTVKQMLFYFFEQHQDGEYSALYITGYIWQTFELADTNKPFVQLRNEVGSNLSNFYHDQDHLERNFDRYQDPTVAREQFLYYYVPNPDVGIPAIINEPNTPRILHYKIQPRQQSLPRTKTNFTPSIEEPETTEEPTITKTGQLCMSIFVEELENSLKHDSTEITEESEIEEPIMQEDDLPPLMQDIRNAEMLSEYQSDKLQYHLEQLISLLPPNCPEISFKKNAYDKLYSFTLTQEA